jgi:hypothetical protein
MIDVIDFASIREARIAGFGTRQFLRERKENCFRFTPQQLESDYLEYEMDGDDEGWLPTHPFILTEDAINPIYSICSHGNWVENEHELAANCRSCGFRMWSEHLTRKNAVTELGGNIKLRIHYEIEIDRSRIDDQTIAENREWALYLFDRSKQTWIQVNSLDAPGEGASITRIQVLNA